MATASSLGFAAAIGGVGGACFAARRGPRVAALAGLAGAAGLATSEAVARAHQRPNEIPALWQRIAVSAALVAPAGSAAEAAGAGPRTIGTLAGATVGALGIRPQKVVMGPLVGLAVGTLLRRTGAPGSVVAAAAVVAQRVLSAAVFRDPQVSLLAERARTEDLPFVVPRPARSRYVGTDYVHALAEELGGTYTPDSRDTGIVAHSTRSPAPTSTRARSIRSCASSTSTRPGSRSTSSRAGAPGCVPATSHTGPPSPGRWARRACR